MKQKLTVTMAAMALLCLNAGFVVAGGGMQGGGGGKKEPLFEEIAENISNWIRSGNADGIADFLPSDVELSDYKSEMLAALSKYHVTFTNDKVVVMDADGKPFEKTCRGYVDQNGVNQIICNNDQFGTDSPDNINEIYRQVHHEFAGLACKKDGTGYSCLEQNKKAESDYRISDHISAFLRQTQVMRLPVAPVSFGDQLPLFGKFMGCFGDAPIRFGNSQMIDRKVVVFRIGAKLQDPLSLSVITRSDLGRVLLFTGSPGEAGSMRLAQETSINGVGVVFLAQERNGTTSVVFSQDEHGRGSARIIDKELRDPESLSSVILTCSDDVEVVSKAIDAAKVYSPL